MTGISITVLILVLTLALGFSTFFWYKETHKRAVLETRFRGILDVDAELGRLQTLTAQEQRKIDFLRSDYAVKRAIYDGLIKEISVFDEKLTFAEMGIYEPHFDFTDSNQYKDAIEKVRENQKQLVSNEKAVICTKQWTVDGSQSKGNTLIRRNVRLTLRAFNNECEAAIANVRWNNANAMEKRIVRAQEQIDNLNDSNFILITPEFLQMKLDELYLTHEYREKQKEEKEERAEASRQVREEQKLMKEMGEAEREAALYQRLLDKAKAEAAKVVGPQLELSLQKIALLERDLTEAHSKLERAQAMAEKTRSGYVYIISNIGSFGEGVVKIGLTRRLDPEDRIRELGDASVPFIFDTHAIIYSEDAPTLEKALHTTFDKFRINIQNYRKEFFRVSIDEVEQAVKNLAPTASFFKDIEAQEYYETLAKRKEKLTGALQMLEQFPKTI